MKNNPFSQFALGSSLTFSAHGWWGKEKNIVAAKNSVRSRKNTAEGGCGGNSAAPERKIEASPAACSVRSRSKQKSFLFLLEEKMRRAQNKSRENFFAGWRALASGGGAASFVGGLPEMRSDFVQGMEPQNKKSGNDSQIFCFVAPELKPSQTFEIILPNLIHKSKKRNLK